MVHLKEQIQFSLLLVNIPHSFYPSVLGKLSFQSICSWPGEAIQVVLPQQKNVFLLRDRQLFVGKLKQKNKYYMLMDTCQEREWGAFNGACQTQKPSANLHFQWQSGSNSPAAPLVNLKIYLINLNYRWHSTGMEIDDTFKNKFSATFGKRNHTFQRGKKKVPVCQNRAFIYCPIYYSLSKINISHTFPFSPLYKTCCGGALEVLCDSRSKPVATVTKSLPRLRAKLARFSVVSAFKYYCNVIVSLKKGEHGNSRAKC